MRSEMQNEAFILQKHSIILYGCGVHGRKLKLRPMSENDCHLLHKWNNDAEVLYFAEGDEVSTRSMEDTMGMYRQVSLSGYCFIIEFRNSPIGECWLQKMNLDHILARYPGLDCRRIDITIGEKEFWNKGIGAEAIGTLKGFAFRHEKADIVFGIPYSHNPRSKHAFEKAGFRQTGLRELPLGSKASYEIEMSFVNPDRAITL